MIWLELRTAGVWSGSRPASLIGGAVTLVVSHYGLELPGSEAIFAQWGLPGRLFPRLSLLSASAGPAVMATCILLAGIFPYRRASSSGADQRDEGGLMRVLGILFPFAWRNLWRNRRRTLITLAVVAVGVWSVIAFNSLIRCLGGRLAGRQSPEYDGRGPAPRSRLPGRSRHEAQLSGAVRQAGRIPRLARHPGLGAARAHAGDRPERVPDPAGDPGGHRSRARGRRLVHRRRIEARQAAPG